MSLLMSIVPRDPTTFDVPDNFGDIFDLKLKIRDMYGIVFN